MSKILGLDLGSNSIGWALIDDANNEILGSGVRIFPMGIDNPGQGEKELSKNAQRSGSRGVRRQHFRKRLRKKILLSALAKHNMCPLTCDDINEWKQNKIFPSEKLTEWFALNPYTLRDRGLKEKLELQELGRIFYHIIQRRGFQSNSRSASSEKSKLYVTDIKSGKIGIDDTIKGKGEQMLGSYLHTLLPKENEPFQQGLERVRNRYTTRDMYTEEFDAIWKHQSQFHNSLTDDLRVKFGGRKKSGDDYDGILFHQRPLRSQKHTLGKCTFESKKPKCPASAIPAEEFRIHQWVNTVECNNQKLSPAERKDLVHTLLRKEKVAFRQLRKILGKVDAQFKFNYKDDDKIVGTHTISNLSSKKYFGDSWFEKSTKEQEDIWHILYFFEDKDKLRQYAKHHWGFKDEKAEEISSFNLRDGYMSLSRKAITNILPFLKQGFTYDMSVAMGGVKNAFGTNWVDLSEERKMFITDHIYDIVRTRRSGGYLSSLKEFIRQEADLPEADLEKLYHHSTGIEGVHLLEKLPVGKTADREIQSIRNPIVVTAIFELRNVVNELIERFGSFDEIKVEMARDLKVSKMQRNKIRREQKRMEAENDRIIKELRELRQVITHENILKYKLWEECKHTCPFTGQAIPISKLFTGEIQIEHIFPWSRSLDDSFMNKTLCYADENRKKGNRTPYEFYGQNKGNWEVIKERALRLFADTKAYPKSYNKFKRFVQRSFDEDFVSRQLNDTRYISRTAKDYLKKICNKINVVPGQATAKLRYYWGLNNILNDDDTKSREDHRHHAIDAIALACTKPTYIKKLTDWNRYHRSGENEYFPTPWEHFQWDVDQSINKILVSHRRDNRILTVRKVRTKRDGKVYVNEGVAARDQLHKETIYGKRKAPGSEEAFHVRKPIENLTTKKHIDKITDSGIRRLILKRINELGGFQKGKIPSNTFFSIDEQGNEKPELYLPNKNGDPVPILKVRIKENFSGAEQLWKDSNAWVNPRNNHHVLIYKDEKGNLYEDIVSFWTVVERKKQNIPIYQLPNGGKEIVTILKENEMFLLGLTEEEFQDAEQLPLETFQTKLYRVQKISSKDYFFRLHNASTLQSTTSPECIRIRNLGPKGWPTYNPTKVTLSPSGKLKLYKS